MEIINWAVFIKKGLPESIQKTAFTVGVFDGVHRGHQALVEYLVKSGFTPAIVMFTEMHKTIQKEKRENQILDLKTKIKILEDAGIKIIIKAELDTELKNMSGETFLNILKIKGRMSLMAIGKNFLCGSRLDTDAEKIQKLNEQNGIITYIQKEIKEGNLPVSSSRIREAVGYGDYKLASAMLGRPFTKK